MLISRTLARQRIDAAVRPSFFGAWVPVWIDLALVFGTFGLGWWVLFGSSTFHLAIIILTGFFLFFLPLQAVVIVSAMWAAKSRWEDAEDQRL